MTRAPTSAPRDRTSVFADATWVAPNRPARVSGTVAPGGTYKFTFDLAAPMTPGMYDEHFGVVEESIAWFQALAHRTGRWHLGEERWPADWRDRC